MAQKSNSTDSDSIACIAALNCVPDIVYWVDADCKLMGCNTAFINLLGMKSPKDLSGTPYDQMRKLSTWGDARIQAFQMDDMKAIFSKETQMDVLEAPVYDLQGEATFYKSRRVPIIDQSKKVVGLVVVLTDVTELNVHQSKALNEAKLSTNGAKIKVLDEPHVLMVEDNFIAQKVEEALLQALHCRVDIAESGDKAIELFDPGKYDIVFMDIGLEDTSGYMVAKKLRQKEEQTEYHVPIIALTSYQAEVVQYDCKDYFMDGVLTKPLTHEQAKQIIQHYIHHEDVTVDGLKSVK